MTRTERLAVVALFAVTVLCFALILVHMTGGVCNPGPKPAAWTHAQYVSYLATACR